MLVLIEKTSYPSHSFLKCTEAQEKEFRITVRGFTVVHYPERGPSVRAVPDQLLGILDATSPDGVIRGAALLPCSALSPCWVFPRRMGRGRNLAVMAALQLPARSIRPAEPDPCVGGVTPRPPGPETERAPHPGALVPMAGDSGESLSVRRLDQW